MKNILFVCTGNTCRSSMAEGILKYILQVCKDIDTQVKSAGTSVYFSESANEKAVIVMEEMGIDIKEHKSQPVSENLMINSDIILTMTNAHKESLCYLFPEARDKVFTLKEYLSNLIADNGNFEDPNFSIEKSDWDITDPYGRSLEVYRKTAQEIKSVLEKLVTLSM